MANLLVDERDAAFVLFEQLNLEDLCKSEHYQEFSREIFEMALNEAQKLAVNEIMPTNIIGDREGCKIENGQVKVPVLIVITPRKGAIGHANQARP